MCNKIGKEARRRWSFVVLTALLLPLGSFGKADGQYASVKRITAETRDGIRISAWTKLQRVRLGQDVVIFYEVANLSDKSIQLVWKSGPLESSIDGHTLLIPIPLPAATAK